LVDDVLPDKPTRQWVLSGSFQLLFLFAARSQAISKVLAVAVLARDGSKMRVEFK
jgi:hypothetical protein